MNNQLKSLISLLLIIFLDSFSYFIIIPILLELFYNPHYTLSPHLALNRDILISITIALSKITALLIAPFMGALSDRYGRKIILLICLTCVSLGFLTTIIGIVNRDLLWIWFARIINGIGTTSQSVAQATIADSSRGKKKAYRLSLIALAMTCAIILGPAFGGYLSKNYTYDYNNITLPYWVAFGFSLILLVFSVWSFKNLKNHSNRRVNMDNIYKLISLRSLIAKYSVGKLFIVFFCLEFGWSQYYQSVFFYLVHIFNYTPQQVSLFSTYLGVVMAIGLMIIYPYLIKRFMLEKINKSSMYLILLSFIMCLLFPYPKVQWIFGTIIAIFTGISYTSLITMVSDSLPKYQQGKAMGYTSTLLFLAWTITACISGILFHINSLLPLCSSILAICVAVYFMFGIKQSTNVAAIRDHAEIN